MSQVPRSVITVSPPNLDRSGFLRLEQGLGGADAPTSRDWLLGRLADGLQVRMLRDPMRGFIEFAPGRSSWRPIDGVDQAVVIECLRVDEQAGRTVAIGALLRVSEDWARYYAFSAVLMLAGAGRDAERDQELRRQSYQVIDKSVSDTVLWGRILQGPRPLPTLPQDWRGRAARLGPGLTVQSVGHCDARLRNAEDLVTRGRAAGLASRVDRLTTAADARAQLVCPNALSCVVLDGEVVGQRGWSDLQIWQDIRRRKGL